MPCICTVDSLACSAANRTIRNSAIPSPLVRDILHKREAFLCKSIWFDLVTVAMVVLVAGAFFGGAPILALLAYLAYQTRKALMKSIDATGKGDYTLQPGDHPFEAARRYLRIPEDAAWDPVRCQILDFRLWMRWEIPPLTGRLIVL
jgi:hypothetical protein